MPKQQTLTTRQNMEAIADGVAFWIDQHPISSCDALANGADGGVTKWLDNNADEFLDRLADKIAARLPGGETRETTQNGPTPLTLSQKRRIVRAFAAAYELAYRRGFQQGFHVREDNPKITAQEIADWRMSEVKTTATPPPGCGGVNPSPLARMLFESREHGEAIQDFLDSEPRFDEDQ